MKRLIVSLACLSALGFVGAAMAQPPGKATILHCGCVLDPENQVGMAYVQISVSSRAIGHAKHAIGATDSCVTAEGGLVEFVRDLEDCQVNDGSAPLADLQLCEAQSGGSSCGTEVLP